MKTIKIDGSVGEGGGQILRTSLGLSVVTGKPFTMTNIRSGRAKSGMMRQHLACLRAAAQICDAKISGDEIGSGEIEFLPGKVKSGDYRFAVGSAGGTGLVLQTVLPALMLEDKTSTLIIEGGTHNPWAPPYDFIEGTFLPVLKQIGFNIDIKLDRAGFFPVGGGRIAITINPCKKTLLELNLVEPVVVKLTKAVAKVSNLPNDIAWRELKRVESRLKLEQEQLISEEVKGSLGPGNIVAIHVEGQQVTEQFFGFGMKDQSAQKVADQAVDEYRDYVSVGAPVGRHLADQLLIPMALAKGGEFYTQKLTEHTHTNIDTIKKFLDVQFSVRDVSKGKVSVCVDV